MARLGCGGRFAGVERHQVAVVVQQRGDVGQAQLLWADVRESAGEAAGVGKG